MKKRLWIRIIVVLLLFVTTIFFPYSFYSLYKSVSFSSVLSSLEKYKMELAAFKNDHEQNESKDRVEYYTDFIINTFEKDLATANRVKMSKRNLNEMLDSVRNLRNMLLLIFFKEELSSESKKYLEEALQWCLYVEEDILRIKDSPHYPRFTMVNLLEKLQFDFRISFEMYTRFYDAYYNSEEEVK